MDDTQTLTPEDRERIVTKFRNGQLHFGYKLKEAARSVFPRLSPKTAKSKLSTVLAGKYSDGERGQETADKALRDLDRWMAIRESQSNAPKLPEFVWIGVAKRMRGVAKAAVDLQTMALVLAHSGFGKSQALKAIAELYPGTIHVEISDQSDTPAAFLREVATVLHLEPRQLRHVNRRNIVERLKDGGRLLMIVDEVNLADVRLLTTIRQLHDATGIAVLLVGQPDFYNTLYKARQDAGIGAQIWSRIQIKCNVHDGRTDGNGNPEVHSIEDMRKLFAKSAVRLHPAAVGWLQAVANDVGMGALRAATKLAHTAAYYARAAGKDLITVEILEQVLASNDFADGAMETSRRIKARRLAKAG